MHLAASWPTRVLRSAGALLPVLLVLAAPAVVHAATFPGQNGKVAFARTFTNQGFRQIFVMLPGGNGQTNLSKNQAFYDTTPDFSRDGKLIAFDRFSISPSTPNEIWVMNTNGLGKHQVTAAPPMGVNRFDVGPAFSPDGTKIVFERGDDSDPTKSGIYMINTNGTGEHRLTTPPAGMTDEGPTFSPDGKKVAFERQTGAEAGGSIMLVSAGGGTPTPLTTNPSGRDGSPNFSPDGKKIAFARGSEASPPGVSHIAVVNVATHALLNLTTQAGLFDEDPSYSPDGTKIAFSREKTSSPTVSARIFVMNANGSSPHNVTGVAGTEDFEPTWQPLPPSDANLAANPGTFSAASTGLSITRTTGTTVSYTAHQPGKTAFSVRRALPGQKSGGKCVKPPPHTTVPKNQRCTRYARLPGGFAHKDTVGKNSFHFTGRLKGQTLAPGRYRLVAVPSIFGRKGPATTASFKVVP